VFDRRSAGVLLHPTSLPGPHGAGDLGLPARSLVDFLSAAGVRHWQVLPLGPVGAGDSPYSGTSVFAGSPLLVSLEALVEAGLLGADALGEPLPSERRADFAAAKKRREGILRRAFESFRAKRSQTDFESFCAEHAAWLDPFVQYSALKRRFGEQPFFLWPEEYRRRRPDAMRAFVDASHDELDYHRFVQWRFFRDLRALGQYARSKGVQLMGDAPIYVAHDSCDVWANPELFLLDEHGEPKAVAGVPPDAFSDEGQLWGNPLYDWAALARTDFGFFVSRLALLFQSLDSVRLDHFIGFTRFWAIPRDSKTAKNGTFHDVPGEQLFETIARRLGNVALVAEDLGVLTDRVRAMRDRFGFPGMNILQFSFSPAKSAEESRPHRHRAHSVVYTGTHDNDTTVGYFSSAPENASSTGRESWQRERDFAVEYLGLPADASAVTASRALVRACLASHVNTAIVPAQDLLDLGRETRMNRPGIAEGNWTFRLLPGELTSELGAKLRRSLEIYGRV
jgi:4-alpha-glucanotransferase